MDFFKKLFYEVGIKKLCLTFHYTLAFVVSMAFFIICAVCTFATKTFDVTVLLNLYAYIMIYVGVVVTYITILSVFDKLQTINKPNAPFDWIAFYIGVCLFVTLGIIIVCIVYMFTHDVTEIASNLWFKLIGVFGGMFFVEAGGGYIYNSIKKKLNIESNQETLNEIVNPP